MKRDLCKTPPFAQSRRQAQILILKILNVFLWLKFSPSLALSKIEYFSKVSKIEQRIGSIHRIGQEKEVTIYNLCATGSAEDYILEVQPGMSCMQKMIL